MDVQIVAVKLCRVDTKLRGMAPDPLQGNGGRLFHHIAEITGNRQTVALARRQGCLGKEDLAAYLRPGKSGNKTNLILVFFLEAGDFFFRI